MRKKKQVPYIEFIEFIKCKMKSKKMTVKFLAGLVNLHPTTLLGYFSGYRKITLDSLTKLLRVFGFRLSFRECKDFHLENYLINEECINNGQ